MSSYIDDIKSLDNQGTGTPQNTKAGIIEPMEIIDVSNEPPLETMAEVEEEEMELEKPIITYLSPKNVIVRKYRLKKWKNGYYFKSSSF